MSRPVFCAALIALIHAASAAPAAAGTRDCAGDKTLSPAGMRACLVGAAPEGEASGWSDVEISVRQQGMPGLRCSLGLAHWYEVTTAPVGEGRPVHARLIARAATGEIALLNDVGDRMRLQEIFCGTPDMPRQGWLRVPIEALRAAPPAAEIICVAAEGRVCRLVPRAD